MIDILNEIKVPIQSNLETNKPLENGIKQQSENQIKEQTKENIKTLKDTIEALNSIPGNKLEFGFNDELEMATISVYERENHKLIREFPSKEFFNRLSYFKETILPGLLMDNTV